MLVFSWNVRTWMSSEGKSCCDFLKIYAIDIVLLQETNTASPLDSFLRSIGGSMLTRWQRLNSLEAAVWQLIGWRENVFDCASILFKEFSLSVQFIRRGTGHQFIVSSAYRPCNGGRRVDFWQDSLMLEGG